MQSKKTLKREYMVKKVTENWTMALRQMRVGDIAEFPIPAISSVRTTLSRLRLEMYKEGADWETVGKPDRNTGTFKIKRIS